jgi:pimeloyl-ACP methyl ester carboxylesterase/class 3 adenylate cyclase
VALPVRFARSGPLFIAYSVEGSSGPALILTPGHFFHQEVAREWPPFAHFIERLAGFSRVILLDRRGTGLSDAMDPATTLDDAMDDIRAVMDDAGVEQAVLMGSAEGGPTCLLFAATFPARVSALILASTFPRRLSAPDYPEGYPPEQHEWLVRVFEERWGRHPVGPRTISPGRGGDPGFRSWYAKVQRFGASPGSAIAWYRLSAEIDVRGVLPAIRVPTLVLHREGDMIVPVGHGRYMAAHIPGARYVEFPGGEHFFFEGDPESMLAEIEEFITGVRPAPAADRVLLTVLMTDIVDSTRRAAALGDRAWRDLLEQHHRVVRAALARFRGREVDMAGDGSLAVFDGPARAIRCALAVSAAVRELGIEVRAGVHTGECEVIGDAVAGLAVHIGARVGALAGRSEVLVSSTVKDLVVGSGFVFEDRGRHELKGVPGEWQVFAVIPASLR